MTERLEHFLALVTVAMPIVLGVAHVLRAVSHQLLEYAVSTPGDGDDKVVRRIVAVADWIDAVAKAIAHAASMGVLARAATPERRPSDPGGNS